MKKKILYKNKILYLTFDEVVKLFDKTLRIYAFRAQIPEMTLDEKFQEARLICWDVYKKYDDAKSSFTTILSNNLRWRFIDLFRETTKFKNKHKKAILLYLDDVSDEDNSRDELGYSNVVNDVFLEEITTRLKPNYKDILVSIVNGISQNELALKYNVKQCRISQIYKAALAKIKNDEVIKCLSPL